MKKITILLIISLVTGTLYSQNIKKAYKLINENKFRAATPILKDAERKNKEMIAVEYAWAKIYSNEKYVLKDYKTAYEYITGVKKKFYRDKKRSKYERKYKISTRTIRLTKQDIEKKALDVAKKENTVEAFDKYLLTYKGRKFKKEAIKIRDKIAYDKAIATKNVRALKKFLDKYPESELYSKAKEIHDNMWKKMYKDIAYYGDIKIFNQFEKDYPDFPFNNNNTDYDRQLAEQAQKLELSKGYNKDKNYGDYIKHAAPNDMAYLALTTFIQNDLKNKKWSSAIKTLKKYKQYFNGKEPRIDKLIKTLEAPGINIKTASISSNINSPAWEYLATFTSDEKTMYFCGRNRPENLKYNTEDIFVSHKINGVWGKPKLVKDINTVEQHEAPLAISGDGNRLLVYSFSDIYYSDKTKTGWTDKRKFPKINKPHTWEADAMMTTDGKAILFVSDRKGNIGDYHPFGKDFHLRKSGNTDIYVSLNTKNGWTKPINIGKTINTPFTERAPYLHSDMKTLYFSSDGRDGLGGLDVYMCKRLNDSSWTEWSEPVNLGKEINTIADEDDYKISTNGKIAYFSAYKNNNYEIYYSEMPEEKRPETVTTISGLIKNKKGENIFATIKWENLETEEIMGFSKSDPNDGSYTIVLPDGKNFGYYVEKKGYYPISGNLDLRVSKGMQITNNITLIAEKDILNSNATVPLKNLFFASGKYTLKPESFPELNRLASFLTKHSKLKAEISGYTDNKGAVSFNKTLSENRAKSVKKYLISKGCNAQRIYAVGYGHENPVAPNNTEEGRAKNRRVEFKIIK